VYILYWILLLLLLLLLKYIASCPAPNQFLYGTPIPLSRRDIHHLIDVPHPETTQWILIIFLLLASMGLDLHVKILQAPEIGVDSDDIEMVVGGAW